MSNKQDLHELLINKILKNKIPTKTIMLVKKKEKPPEYFIGLIDKRIPDKISLMNKIAVFSFDSEPGLDSSKYETLIKYDTEDFECWDEIDKKKKKVKNTTCNYADMIKKFNEDIKEMVKD
jgi:hypothetical protein